MSHPSESSQAGAALHLERAVQRGDDRHLGIVVKRWHARIAEQQCRLVVVPAVDRREVVISAFSEFVERNVSREVRGHLTPSRLLERADQHRQPMVRAHRPVHGRHRQVGYPSRRDKIPKVHRLHARPRDSANGVQLVIETIDADNSQPRSARMLRIDRVLMCEILCPQVPSDH